MMRAALAHLLTLAALADGFGRIVITDDGPIIGRSGPGLRIFHGVPFAASPAGERRFRPPARPARWSIPRPCLWPGPVCPQLDIARFEHIGREDCLHLSVYAPDSCSAAQPCPVMQWIHGGAWILGSNYQLGEYNATGLALRHRMVVVAANYRLDSLGWLALDELDGSDAAYGNYGLLDQQAALQWTRRNIERFGGDPEAVTIFGESAGGFSVCQHLVSPPSNGLFSRAIMQSGDCDGPWLIHDGLDAKRWGDAVSTAVGCAPNKTRGGRVACLRQLPLRDILMSYTDWLCPGSRPQPANPWCNFSHTNRTGPDAWPSPRPPFAPIAAWTASVDGVVLPDSPINLIRAGKINRSPSGAVIPVMLGTVIEEFGLFTIGVPLVIQGTHYPVRFSDFKAVAQHLIRYHRHWNQSTAERIVAAYPPSDYHFGAALVVEAGTDFCFRCGTRDAARALSAAGVPTYLYQFSYRPQGTRSPDSLNCEVRDEVLCGVKHGDDVPYIFHDQSQTAWANASDRQMAVTMQGYWAAFARTGSPNRAELAAQWPRYNQSSDMHLELGNVIEQRSGLAAEKCDFWDSLPRAGHYHH